MKIGIIGAGRIAQKVTKTLAKMPEIELYAVASRDLKKAQDFAKENGYMNAYGSYFDLYNDSNVELVYVCVPHSKHLEVSKDALAAGKNVLCEKPITVNAKELEELIDYAKDKPGYLAEAMWVRYMPSYQIIRDALASGVIGKPSMLVASLSYSNAYKERIMSKDLAGGALLDLGVYGLNFAAMYFGYDIESIKSCPVFAETGIDKSESITIKYKDGKIAILSHAIDCVGPREGVIHGDKGYIVVDNINCPTKLDVYNKEYELLRHEDLPIDISGYEFEFREAASQIEKGECESKSMPLSESLKIMKLCDEVRKSW